MSVIVDFSIFPVDKGASVSRYVAEAVKIIRQSGLPHQTNPMGTSIEGEWEEVMGLVGACFDKMKENSDRIYMTLKVDYRKGEGQRLSEKIISLEQKLKQLKE
jgi:uncharacterized protein (TIGR00106 family)